MSEKEFSFDDYCKVEEFEMKIDSPYNVWVTASDLFKSGYYYRPHIPLQVVRLSEPVKLNPHEYSKFLASQG